MSADDTIRGVAMRLADGPAVRADGSGEYDTHLHADRGLYIPFEHRAFGRQIVIRTPRGTVQHFGSDPLDPYYGMVTAKDFGDPGDLHDPRNTDLAPNRVSIKPEGEAAVTLTVDLEPELRADGGPTHCDDVAEWEANNESFDYEPPNKEPELWSSEEYTELYDRVISRRVTWRCQKCSREFPSLERARRHAGNRHSEELLQQARSRIDNADEGDAGELRADGGTDTAPASKYVNPTAPGYIGTFVARSDDIQLTTGPMTEMGWPVGTTIYAVDRTEGIALVDSEPGDHLGRYHVSGHPKGRNPRVSICGEARAAVGVAAGDDVRAYRRGETLVVVPADPDPLLAAAGGGD